VFFCAFGFLISRVLPVVQNQGTGFGCACGSDSLFRLVFLEDVTCDFLKHRDRFEECMRCTLLRGIFFVSLDLFFEALHGVLFEFFWCVELYTTQK
jgi:hypothetical protein